MSNILEIKDLNVRFGGIRAVDGISMNVQEGKIITLIGANGAVNRPFSALYRESYAPQAVTFS